MPAEQAFFAKESDDQLVAAVRDGDDEAMGALFARHHAAIHSLCARLIHDSDVADDITQEVFLRVWRYARTFHGRSSFRTWLFRLAYNACADLRSRNARFEGARVGDLPATDPPSVTVPDRHVLLDTALRRLSPEQRAVLVLSRFHGLGYQEIGRILECSPAAARVRLHRAMKELRQLCFALDGRCT
jgi:RNA polymerase sigma factor (sigma-70 family)